MKRVVVGYPGGFDAAVTVPWLAESYGAEVVALTLDLGQGVELEGVRDAALARGAARAHVLDVREEFARDYVLPALRADALDDGGFPMPVALSRPLIARKLVDIAGMEGATAIASPGFEADGAPSRVAAVVRGLNPSLEILDGAPAWAADREAVRAYARTHGVTAGPDEAYRADANLWGRSVVPTDAAPGWPPPAVYRRTRAPDRCSDEPAIVEIAFDAGAPVALNGVTMPMVEFVAALDVIAGSNGVGRLEPTAREIREAPAAVVLHAAHAALRARLAPGDAAGRLAASAAYAGLIREGRWFTPARDELDAAARAAENGLTGVVRLRLCRGACKIDDL